MVVQTYHKIHSANGWLHALVIQTALERAGIPATLAKSSNGSYLDVLVPEEWVEQAQALLFPRRPTGEQPLVPLSQVTD